MFKFIFLFLYLSFCTATNLSSMAPDAPTPQQRFSIFRSLNIDHEKQLVYREIIPIIATGDKQESLDLRPFILQNKVTGAVAFQIRVSQHANPDTMSNINNKKDDANTPVFDLSSIAFTSKDDNRKNAKFLPIVKSPQQTSSTEELNTSYIGSVYLFPDDITNLIISITKDSSATIQKPFLTSDFIIKTPSQQLANQFLPINLSVPSRELHITLKNTKEEEIVLSFSPYYATILRSALEFYIRLL